LYFGGIAELYAQIQKRLSYRACFELLRKLQKNQLREKFFENKRNVTLKNVAFSYPSRKEIKVLKDVNFTANFGQKINRWS
jgi:ABC-type multidrug transport system fused ATPase/permease subunit